MNHRLTALGAGLGIPLGVAFLTALCFYILEKKKNRRLEQAKLSESEKSQYLGNQGSMPWKSDDYPRLHEAPENPVRSELPTNRQAHEVS